MPDSAVLQSRKISHNLLYYTIVSEAFQKDVALQYWWPVPGLLNTKEGRMFHLLLSKRWHLLPPFLSNEPGTENDLVITDQCRVC
jgi:hypothetical protein